MATSKEVSLVLTGDIMLGGEFRDFKDSRNLGWEYPFDQVRPFFEEADIVFANLECTLSKSGATRKDKGMALYSPSDSIEALKYLGCNVISLANNHINDYGEEGLIETMGILNENHIPCFGAGKNLEEAGEGMVIEAGGLKFGFLGYTTQESHVNSIIADANHAGCVAYDLPRMEQDIARIKPSADMVCVSLHWGYRDHVYPSARQVELAHSVVDAGANIVIGHHPHVVQGWERYKHAVIFYSLGNFFFPDYCLRNGRLSRWSKANNTFIIARCHIANEGVQKVEILPGYRSDEQELVLLEDKRKEDLISEIDKLSLAIQRSQYQSFYTAYHKKWEQEQLHDLLRRVSRHGFGGITVKPTMGVIKLYLGISVRYLGDVLARRR